MAMISVPTARCPVCHIESMALVDSDEFNAFLRGRELIQDAMPTTAAPIREQIMTGTHPGCWEKMMAEPEG